MKHLPLPADSGDAVVMKVIAKKGWEPYQERWLAALAAYREHKGNPWSITPVGFTGVDHDNLFKLYDTRRTSKPIRKIRHADDGHASCPVCGSPAGPSVDHALPRSVFPEFSILRENLLPACTMCNSDEKGEKYRGEDPPLRFIHPYYDEWIAGPIWHVAFSDDLQAPVFLPEPEETLSVDRKAILAFHLRSVLGESWRSHCARFWGSLPLKLNVDLGPTTDAALIAAQVEMYRRHAVIDGGENCWTAAFLRGVLRDSRVPEHLASALTSFGV